MSFGMAFFSLSVALKRSRGEADRSEAGGPEPEWIAEDVLHHVARVVKYYENIRLVYEIEFASAGVQAGNHTRRTGPQGERAGQNPQRLIPVDNPSPDRREIIAATKTSPCWPLLRKIHLPCR